MKQLISSPWFAITLAVVGMIGSYSYVLVQRGEAFNGSAFECLVDGEHKALDTQ